MGASRVYIITNIEFYTNLTFMEQFITKHFLIERIDVRGLPLFYIGDSPNRGPVCNGQLHI